MYTHATRYIHIYIYIHYCHNVLSYSYLIHLKSLVIGYYRCEFWPSWMSDPIPGLSEWWGNQFVGTNPHSFLQHPPIQ